MRRAAPTIPVSSKMIRHFAVLTIVITAGLAMFASGENRQALADTVERQQAKNSVRQAERQKLGNHRKVGTTRPAQSDDGEAPVDSDGPADGGGYDPAEDSFATPRNADWAGPNGDAMAPGAASRFGGPEQDAPPAKDRGLRAGPGKEKPGQQAKKRPPRPTQRQIEEMFAASRDRASRSGTASSGSDAE